jgi:hypothetical protein
VARADPIVDPSPAPMPLVEVDVDDLIDAPIVQPSRKVVTESQRRAQARRERLRSASDDEGVL